MIHTVDIQDRATLLLAEIIRRFPCLQNPFADGGYAGDKLREALRRIGKGTVEIIKRSEGMSRSLLNFKRAASPD